MLVEMLIYTIIACIAIKLYMKLSLVDTLKIGVTVYVCWLLLVIVLCI